MSDRSRNKRRVSGMGPGEGGGLVCDTGHTASLGPLWDLSGAFWESLGTSLPHSYWSPVAHWADVPPCLTEPMAKKPS